MHRQIFAAVALFLVAPLSIAQSPEKSASSGTGGDLPKLEKFDPVWIDKSKDACVDFYAYTCSKWLAAHPISPDLPTTGTALPLFLYNQTILRNALETAAANKQASGSERQIGDYWQSCMDVKVRDANGKSWLQPSMSTIASLKSSQDCHVSLPTYISIFQRHGRWGTTTITSPRG